jgi:predicted negative regulator of RcsB-dependent stress response
MKAKERHQLKQNEFAETTRRTIDVLKTNQRQITLAAVAVVLVAGGIGGFLLYRSSRANEAGAKLGTAMAIAQATISPPSTLPGAKQPPGTYPSENARSEASIKALQEVIAAYPGTPAALTAKYETAGELLDLGRHAEAEKLFAEVAAANSELYTAVARLGVAQAKVGTGQYDDAVKLLTELAANRDGTLPIDGVLIQLGQVYVKAGKPQDARAAYQRVVDEFSDSSYASEARQQLAALN